MNLRRILAEAAILVGLAVACALVANLFAGRERRLAIPGSYPGALVVPGRGGAPGAAPTQAGPATPAISVNLVTPITPVTAPSPAAVPGPAPGATPSPARASAVAGTPVAASHAAPDPGRPAARGAASSPAPAASAEAPGRATPAGAAKDAEVLARFPPHHKPLVEISGEDALWLHARGALVLDARRTKVFEAGHIAGARSFPVWESDIGDRVMALMGEGRDGRLPVVLYCAGGDCEDSHLLAEKLFGAGFENLLVYKDGWPDWQRRGGPSAAGAEP